MSSYNELIKSFDNIRDLMRDFYIYGIKSREQYNRKSPRAYDDDRRRLESWLGQYVSSTRSGDGKRVFISLDSRSIEHNPFYKAFKAKSFTDGDITLHFILFDILYREELELTLADILAGIDERLSGFAHPMTPDESTVRKKLNEYVQLGLIIRRKQGRQMLYSRSVSPDISKLGDMLHYFSEVAPCGVLGSFLLDKGEYQPTVISFKHHYITWAMDSEVIAALLDAMHQKRRVNASYVAKDGQAGKDIEFVPLRLFISAQNGRVHILSYCPGYDNIRAFRTDRLCKVKQTEAEPQYDELRILLDKMQKHMWGVTPCKSSVEQYKSCRDREDGLEHVEFTVFVGKGEQYVAQRLEREKRIGRVERVQEQLYRFTADVYSSQELIPWIRSFICRIRSIDISNKDVESRLRSDLEKMYSLYGVGGEASDI